MLVLQREIGERLYVGPDIVVTITKVKGTRVWVGIDAPRDRVILRDEVLQRIKGDDPFGQRNGNDQEAPR